MTPIKPLHAALSLAAVAVLASLATSFAEAPPAPAARRPVQTATTEEGATARAMESPWKAVAASGRVETGPPAGVEAPWRRLGRGDRVRPLSQVRTRKRSRATLTRLGDVILVDPETRLTLPGGVPGAGGTVRQRSGNVLYEIDSSAGASLRVATPFLVAGVKGTVFSVIADESFSSVSVISGRVGVRAFSTGQEVDLLAGDMAVFDGERGELEIYRQAREGGREQRGEISENARRSRSRTVRLLEGASASLTDESPAEETWSELRSLDMSLWHSDGELRKLELDSTLEEDRKILTNEEDGKLISLGLKKR